MNKLRILLSLIVLPAVVFAGEFSPKTRDAMAKLQKAEPAELKLPEYPEMMMQSKHSGLCVVGFTVKANGEAADAYSIQSSNQALELACVPAVLKSSFKPKGSEQRCYAVFDFVYDRATGKALVKLRGT